MTYYIYGFRICGDMECRYVGMTSKTPEDRLANLSTQARTRVRWGKRDPDGFDHWLHDNLGNVETFKIAKVETREEAHATERAIVALILRLNHRLFNHWLVPAERRIAWAPVGYGRRAARHRARARQAAA